MSSSSFHLVNQSQKELNKNALSAASKFEDLEVEERRIERMKELAQKHTVFECLNCRHIVGAHKDSVEQMCGNIMSRYLFAEIEAQLQKDEEKPIGKRTFFIRNTWYESNKKLKTCGHMRDRKDGLCGPYGLLFEDKSRIKRLLKKLFG